VIKTDLRPQSQDLGILRVFTPNTKARDRDIMQTTSSNKRE